MDVKCHRLSQKIDELSLKEFFYDNKCLYPSCRVAGKFNTSTPSTLNSRGGNIFFKIYINYIYIKQLLYPRPPMGSAHGVAIYLLPGSAGLALIPIIQIHKFFRKNTRKRVQESKPGKGGALLNLVPYQQ